MNKIPFRWAVAPGFLFIFLAQFLAGCGSLLPAPPGVREFTLSPVALKTGAIPLTTLNLRVAIDEPYGGNRLLIRDQNGELRPYAAGRWAAPLSRLMESSWAFSIEQSKLAAMALSGAARGGHYPLLDLQVRAFYAAVGEAGGEIHLRLVAAYLAKASAAPVVRSFAVDEPARIGDVAALAADFDAAHRKLIEQALVWLMEPIVGETVSENHDTTDRSIKEAPISPSPHSMRGRLWTDRSTQIENAIFDFLHGQRHDLGLLSLTRKPPFGHLPALN